MLVDTDVLIWYLRGDKKAKITLDKLEKFSISSITYMEVLQGLRNKSELKLWRTFLLEREVKQILLDHQITSKAIYWMEQFTLSHNLRMADALIAATADVFQYDLLTANHTDYKFLPGISIKIFKQR